MAVNALLDYYTLLIFSKINGGNSKMLCYPTLFVMDLVKTRYNSSPFFITAIKF